MEIAGGRPGPWWASGACVDTTPYGDETARSFLPSGGLPVLLDAAEHTASGAPARISPTRTRSAQPG
jgi:hypothetical protein